MFAQAFNFQAPGVLLRLAGLVVLIVTVVCLGVIELGTIRSRKLRIELRAISGIGFAAVLLIAYISTAYL